MSPLSGCCARLWWTVSSQLAEFPRGVGEKAAFAQRWVLISPRVHRDGGLIGPRCRTAHGKSVNLWEEPWALVHSTFECLHGGRWRPSGARAGD